MTVTAEAVASHGTCDNVIVTVPERGRIDSVTRSLLVKVGIRGKALSLKMAKIHIADLPRCK